MTTDQEPPPLSGHQFNDRVRVLVQELLVLSGYVSRPDQQKHAGDALAGLLLLAQDVRKNGL